MAEDVVDVLARQFRAESGRTFRPCQTKHLPISGGDIGGSDNLEAFIAEKGREALELGLSEYEGRILAKRYGTNVDRVFAFAKEAVEGDTDLPPFVFAQYKYALMEEMIVKPVDFFIRRTGALFFNIDWVRQWKDLVIAEMAKDLKWTEEEKKMYTEGIGGRITGCGHPH